MEMLRIKEYLKMLLNKKLKSQVILVPSRYSQHTDKKEKKNKKKWHFEKEPRSEHCCRNESNYFYFER